MLALHLLQSTLVRGHVTLVRGTGDQVCGGAPGLGGLRSGAEPSRSCGCEALGDLTGM
ncbi:hypothetical protein ACFW6F_10950 [Streptomyces sp. NPDC058746]|uniref:hypothetical protein n=1 Tax=Streptomyces sp. NPDC058746 TaxID=3346622 RepID=UPI0036C2B974